MLIVRRREEDQKRGGGVMVSDIRKVDEQVNEENTEDRVMWKCTTRVADPKYVYSQERKRRRR